MALPRMDSRIGLDYIVENNDYISKLGTALDTNNATVKKQVFELLSALCAYNSEGYSCAIEALVYFKNLKKERYRFKVIVNELEKADVVEYQIALLAFINCVIISAPTLQDRLRIRNEFIGLNLLPILSNLRRVAHSVGDIIVQLDVFDEQRECDEDQSLQGSNGINLNSHLDVFYAILRQVADTPQEIPFLSILQHLLRIDPKEGISDIIWDTTEKLVHRATLLENHEDSARLLRVPSIQKFTCPHCRGEAISPSRKQSTVIPTTPSSVHPISSAISVTPLQISTPPPPPPPAPPLPFQTAPPPPPPPMMMNNNRIPGAPPIPPPPAPNLFLSANHLEHSKRPKTPEMHYNESQKLLPQQETPAPKSKMKTINWNKIPPNKVLGKRNIWAIVADTHQDSPMADLDWNEMEGLFCLQSTNSQGTLKTSIDNGADVVDRRARKENSEISLLDGKRSLNVNIFLKQFRSSNENIIELIKDGEHDDIGAEKLKGLLKILPELDEVEMLRSFDGEKSKLGNAEKFLLQLLQVPNYKLRIESMLLKEEFATNVGYLEPFMSSMLYAGHDLMNNKLLQEVLYMVVVAGNFLNSGGYAGNAAGVKLSSLQKITDIRANKPGMNLIHFVALQAEKRNPDLLLFPAQMSALENASKTTPEQINNEINALDSRTKKIRRQIELNTTEIDIKNQMMEFLKAAEIEVSVLQQGMKEVDLMRNKLADFFCEDPSTFKIEECFKVFQSFCEKFKQAIKENERRRVQEEQATLRKKQREEQIAKRVKQSSQCGTPISDSENNYFLDPSQFDMKCSPSMSRRRMGSFNSTEMKEEGMSPDITPNGSLRRRRSRILMDEDEGSLMEFLRTSGHDNGSRERKISGYGSLDRSWARRAQTGSSSKKRPDLLNIDFGQDRERPNSPSPLAESKPIITQEETKPRISKEWRQKIESWLQANENDERQIDDYKRRRRLVTKKRLLENDTESDRNKLDPLPEEKATSNNSGSNLAESYKRVYPDWKPSTTLEKTDVVRTIEAIEDAQNLSKDKTAWRKSNLQSPKSFEKSDDDNLHSKRNQPQQLHNLREITNSDPKSSFASILDEKRKSIIQKLGERNPSDSLQIYIRRSSDSEDNSPKENLRLNNTVNNGHRGNSLDNNYSTLLHGHKETISNNHYNNNNNHINSNNKEINNKSSVHPTERNGSITIDSDESHNLQNLENDILSNSNFDRFSAARKTRRYKKQIERGSNETANITSPTTSTIPVKTSLLSPSSTKTTTGITSTINLDAMKNDTKSNYIPLTTSETKDYSQEIKSQSDNKEERLKRWQEQLKERKKYDGVVQNPAGKTVAKLEKVGRHISSINQEDVREAIRNLKSPTRTPERIWSPPRDTPKDIVVVKITSHELNDEGFEETQSLVSDTPSHGKESNSSCNEPSTDNKKATAIRRHLSGSTTSTLPTQPRSGSSIRTSVQHLMDNNKTNFERSRSMKTPTPVNSPEHLVSTRRSNSFRRNESQSQGGKTVPQNSRDVERSSSRTSLRSSRSSLNSVISTSTVRKMGQKPQMLSTTSSSSLLSPKRSLISQNTGISKKTTSRVPASRSSSSGSSSLGISKPPMKASTTFTSNSLGNTSFKENHQRDTSRNRTLIGTVQSINHNKTINSITSNTGSKTASRLIRPTGNSSRGGVSGFMRPTTSSTTKRQHSDTMSTK